MADTTSKARAIASGWLSLSTAKCVFMLSGYAIYFALPRLLSTAEFGNYGVTIGFLSVFNMMLVVGAIQSVSKFVSEDPRKDSAVRKASCVVQGVFGGGTSVALFLTAPWAARAFNDPSLTPLIRTGSIIPILYAFYAAVIGSLNGRRLYRRQASLDITFALIKTALVISGAYLAGSVIGAVAGFSVTAVAIMLIGGLTLWGTASEPEASPGSTQFPLKKYFRFQASIMILTLLGNVLINLDLFLVKSILQAGMDSDAAGLYTAVQAFSRIPYLLAVALALVLFPLMSSSSFTNNMDQCRRYIRTAFRFPLVVFTPLSLFIACFAADCLDFVYPPEFRSAAPALAILVLAEIVLALFYIAITMINSSGSPMLSVLVTGVAIVVHALASVQCIDRYGLTGAAYGSLAGWTTGFCLSGLVLMHRFRAFIPPLTAARVAVASAGAVYAARVLPGTGMLRMGLGLVLIPLLFWGFLWLMREFTLSELSEMMKKVF
ncbi:oligosaccharide flippase family protein [bacterium]|nr:oligosaccharide flippase family protein [candidate division CSSED10-310 bacterium]